MSLPVFSSQQSKKSSKSTVQMLFPFFIFLYSCQSPSSFSQGINGIISDSSVFNNYIFLWETIGNHSYKIDSVKISSEGKFFFANKNFFAGYYFLSLNDTNRVDLILSPSEKNVELEFSEKLLQNGIKIIYSDENKILWEYKFISKSIYGELKNIYIQKSYIPVPPQNASDSAALLKLKHIEDSLNDYKKQELKKLCEKEPNTFFAKSGNAALRKKYDSKEEEKKHFFETVDFADASLIRSNVFPNNMMDYLQLHTDYNEDGFKSSVDSILQKAKTNPDVYEFCLNYLLELFNRVGPDIIFQYLTEKYLIGEGCSDLNVSENFKSKAETYRLLLPGNKIPEIILPDISAKEKKLSAVVSKNKITVLFFWSSHCNFCHKAIPDLLALYSEYNSKGLEIAAISLDEIKPDWEKYVSENKLNWINLCELKGWKSTSVDKLKVHKTPSFYLLNNQMTILSKPASAADLKIEVEKYF